MLVHRAVLFAFVGKCPEGMEAIHIDGNAKNNHISNLKWGTHGENMGMDRGHNHSFKGNKNPNCKLTAVQVHEIRIAYKKGGWWGRREFSKKLGVTETQVGRIAKRLYGGWK